VKPTTHFSLGEKNTRSKTIPLFAYSKQRIFHFEYVPRQSFAPWMTIFALAYEILNQPIAELHNGASGVSRTHVGLRRLFTKQVQSTAMGRWRNGLTGRI
jgi:hypothetical protein